METKNIILIAIAILVIALIAVGIYSVSNGTLDLNLNPAENNTTNFIDIGTINADDINDTNNTTVVGDNSTLNISSNLTNNNTPYKVYDPQSDSYVPVIGEKFDEEVNRWYTYDEDGVRYYNTRIN
ncbi:hypothetical protein [Methanobrevibacter sp.]|uniref:hypothetical protein n=1 Tax=Methanobrevibacter sp. TaxID=66852 RepID=UPI00388E149C